MRVRKLVLTGLIAMLMLGLVACGDDGDDDEGTVLGGRSTADMTINDKFPFYEPREIALPANRELRFTVLNEGERLHNITIPALSIDMDVAAGQTIEVKIPATASAPRDGFFLFYCKYHQAEGEAGRINIVS